MKYALHLVSRKSCVLIFLTGLIWSSGFSQNPEVREALAFISQITEDQNLHLHEKTIATASLKQYPINFEDLNFWNPCKQKLETDHAFLSKEEWEALNSAFYNQKRQKIPNTVLKGSKQSDATKDKTTYITWPILFRDNSWAVFYSEQRYGGQINLLRKENGTWQAYCSYMVWIE